MAEFNIASFTALKPGPSTRRGSGGGTIIGTSRLLSRHLRPHANAFYRFLRLADGIADDPDIDPETKLGHLDALEKALTTGQASRGYLKPAIELRTSLQSTSVSDRHARQVLRAFRRDALGARCHTWSDLLLYCRFSAAPVGRFLLDLHHEPATSGPVSDALCAAVQILNHLQDCRADWIELGRCYLPLAWFDEAGISAERLVEDACDPVLRSIFDRALDQVDRLLIRAAPLPTQIKHRGLRLESSVMLSTAEALSRRLRLRDPLRRPVCLSTHQRVLATARGIARGLSAR